MSRRGSKASCNSLNTGLAVDDIIDRLVSTEYNEQDENIVPIFLTFFRRFMRPCELIDQLVERFKHDGFSSSPTAQQKRIYSILLLWLSHHWNDFYAPRARRLMVLFLDHISKHESYTPICDSLAPLVIREPPSTDPDSCWGLVDEEQPAFSNKKDSGYVSGTFHLLLQQTPPQSPREDSVPRLPRQRYVTHSESEGYRRAEFAGGMINIDASNTPYAPSTLTNASNWTSYISIMNNFRKQDQLNLKTIMGTSDNHIAKQLTWIESQLFSRIQPREFLRYIVSNQSSSNSSMILASIAHFNFISSWVATLIISQSRASKRANVFLKFISIAVELRNMNNYNSLMAVLAGMNNAAILRLKQTRQIVATKKIYKQFLSLERLMSTDKSFCAYRMALRASKGSGIPYLGIHTQDLVSLAEANKDFRPDGTVHWDKYRLMGETIMSIMKFKHPGYTIDPDLPLLLSIADCPILSEDELYKKSTLVEPKVNTNSNSRLKELWLRLK
ncbi:hypothetical protein RMATCC62417_09072 [Rhizopus microsporus]|nr:hypothetical protein RMATCC62417_09072 [Rhizopus microsporus]